MKIYIPTRGRPDRQPTLEALRNAGFKPTLVLSTSDPRADEYTELYSPTISVRAANIHEKRQAILELVGNRPFVMMDDDLTFFARQKDGRFLKAVEGNLQNMLLDIQETLMTYAHVGISDKFMAHKKPRGAVQHGRYNQVLAYNPSLFPKPWPKFRMMINEEHDFHLQLATRGQQPCILTEFSKDAKYYAEGGCSAWRTPKVERESFRQMEKQWPGLVKLVAIPRRPGIRMQVAWKKAVEQGRK